MEEDVSKQLDEAVKFARRMDMLGSAFMIVALIMAACAVATVVAKVTKIEYMGGN